MKRFAQVVAVSSLAVFLLTTMVQAGQAGGAQPTVDQVLEKAITALGGRAAMEKITSRTSKGTVEVPDAGMNGSVQVYEKAPNMNAIVIEFGGTQMRQGSDGTVAWEDNPQTGMREKAGVELAEAKREATFNPELKMKQLYPKMTVRGKEKVGTAEAWVIDAVPAEGSPAVFYYDAATGLLLRMDASRDIGTGSPVLVQAFVEDYRDVDGMKVPFVLRQVTPMFSIVMRLTEVKHNVTLDDKMFKKPGF